jgi:PAS domain S-box-containing protein
MADRDKTQAQLIAEVQQLRQRIAELESPGTQEVLRRQRGIFETIARNAPILVVWLEPDGTPRWVNPAWERTLGWSLEEARSLDVFAHAYPDPDYRRYLFGFIQTAQGGWGEFETRRRDGTLLYIMWTGVQLADGATLALGRDISAQKRLEQALRTSETKYRTLFEAAGEGILLMKADRFVDCNRRALQIFGATRQQLIGRTPADFSPHYQADGCRSWEKASEKIHASLGGLPQFFEWRHCRLDGSLIDTEVSLNKISLPDGVYLQAIVRDITERQQAEQALRQSEERYRILFEDAPISLWEEDFSDVKRYLDRLCDSGVDDLRRYLEDHPDAVAACVAKTKVLDVNKATVALYRAGSKEELLGDLSRIAGQGAEAAHTESILAIAQGETAFEWEAPNYTLVGDRLDVEIKWSIIPGYEETFARALLSIIDVTGRKQAEEALHQYAERLKAMHMLDHSILAAESPQAIAQAALGQLRDLIPCVRASVSVFDWPTGRASSLASEGVTELDLPSGYSLEVFGDVQQLRQGQVHLVEDIQALPRPLTPVVQVLYDFGVRSYMNVPLIAHEELVGSLNLGWAGPGGYRSEHVEMAQEVADSLAIALQQARLLEAERQAHQTAETLRQATAALTPTQSVGQVLDNILLHLEHVVAYDSACVFLHEGPYMHAVAGRGFTDPQKVMDCNYPAEQDALFAEVRRTGRPLILADLSADPRFRAWAESDHVRGWLGVPLVVRDEIIGILTIDSRRVAAFGEDEAALAQAFANQAAVAIQNARLFGEVVAGRQRLQLLSHRLLEVQENERRHIARELHDEVGQTLTGLKLLLEMSSRLPPDGIQANLDEALGLVNQLAERVDELSLDLRPGMLDDLGLLPALLWHFEHYSKQTGVQVKFQHAGLESRRFEPEVETAAYRIVQEALTNVARHASVGQAEVRCVVTRHMLSLQIRDQGAGFDTQGALASATSSGLLGIRERVTLLEGQLTIDSAPQAGTRLTVELPVDRIEQGRSL